MSTERLPADELIFFQTAKQEYEDAQAVFRRYVLHLCRQHGLRPGVDDIKDDGTIVRAPIEGARATSEVAEHNGVNHEPVPAMSEVGDGHG